MIKLDGERTPAFKLLIAILIAAARPRTMVGLHPEAAVIVLMIVANIAALHAIAEAFYI